MPHAFEVRQINRRTGDLIATFSSPAIAAEKTGVALGTLRAAAGKHRKTGKPAIGDGFRWEYGPKHFIHPEGEHPLAHLPSLEELFAQGDHANGYVRFGDLESYHRLGRRMINGRMYKTVDRANTKNITRPANITTCSDQRLKPTGLYKGLDDLAVELARKHGFEAIYIECVHNKFLPKALLRYGYTEIPRPKDQIGTGRNFFKLLETT